jgi:lysophospholipase L1-like esterase
LRRLHVLDFTPLLNGEHYFDLDDHLNGRGHELVARELARALARLGGPP